MITDSGHNLVKNQDSTAIIKLDTAKNPNSDLVEVVEYLIQDCENMEVSLFMITDQTYSVDQINSLEDLIIQDGPQKDLVF